MDKASMNKQAVDQTTKEYWTDYFKEFGQMWVRDIPRRIKQAAQREIKAKQIDGEFVPIAHDVSKDKTLSVEAGLVGKVDGQNAQILVTAAFSPDGKMESIDIVRLS